MKSLPTKLDGVVLIEPVVHGDARGFMVEDGLTVIGKGQAVKD